MRMAASCDRRVFFLTNALRDMDEFPHRIRACRLLASLGDDEALVCTSDTCPSCVSFADEVPRLEAALAARGMRVRHVSPKTHPELRHALRQAGYAKVPSLLTRAHGAEPAHDALARVASCQESHVWPLEEVHDGIHGILGQTEQVHSSALLPFLVQKN
jgi:hypothetical protein